MPLTAIQSYKLVQKKVPSYKVGIFLLFMLFCNCTVKAQQEPRYSRFQHHKYKWRTFRSKAFHIYFPADAADSLYRFIVKETPDAIFKIKKATIKDLPKHLNIIVYPSVDQLYESNIGAWESQQFTIPTFVHKGTRIVLSYNGSLAALRSQLKEGLARTLWESEMNDGSKEEQSTMNNGVERNPIPYWFKEGAIRYFAYGWEIGDEDKFRTCFEQNNLNSMQQILNAQPRIGGQAFCYFLANNYHPKAVAQTFFQIKKKKSVPRALRLITKRDMDTLFQQCYNYYKKRCHLDTGIRKRSEAAISFQHRKGVVQQVIVSPNNKLIAYVLLENGDRNLYLYSTDKQVTIKTKKYKLPPWINSHSINRYPIVKWNKQGTQLYIVQPRNGKVTIAKYSPDGKLEERTVINVDGVTGFELLSDHEFLLSAYRNGQSDIVVYNETHDSYTAFTNDEYDNAQPMITGNVGDILFVSERPHKQEKMKTYYVGVGFKKDTLMQGIYCIKDSIIKPVITCSAAGYTQWDKLVYLKDNLLLATTTKNGMEQNVLINYVTGVILMLGKYSSYQYLQSSNEISEFIVDKDSVYINLRPLEKWIRNNEANAADTTSPWLNDYNKLLADQIREDSLLGKGKDTTHYFMDNIFSSVNFQDTVKSKSLKKQRKKATRTGDTCVEPYVLQLHSAYFTAKVNNDYFINRYQPYLNYQGEFKFPQVGGITKGGFADLFENHHFTIAYKLPAATEGSDFFVRYENTEKKVDWGFSYFRKVESLKPMTSANWVDENGNKYPGNAKGKTNNYELFAKYPLSFYSYFGFQTSLRKDKTVFLATDKYSLDFLPIETAWSITTFSYNLNKIKPTLPNLFRGFKAEVQLDLFKGFSRQEAFVFGSAINLSYHLPTYKYITIVTQLHAGYSGGDEKILYNMGGTDNNVTPQIDTSVHFHQYAPYAFQTLVTPFRGYFQNSLYGNQYALANVDVYFPIFQSLRPIETPLPFVNNLQFGAFTDIGAAKEKWYNYTPSGKSLHAFGISARTTLAGYPLRLDLAWPGSFNKRPVVYFSLKM